MTWPTFHTEVPFQELKVTENDMKLATLAFGWTLGFGYFVAWHAFKLSRRWSTFTIMCWLEIFVSIILATTCWLYLCGVIKHSFWFYFMTVTMWALQVQLLLQIIVNRICILLPTPQSRLWLKFVVAVWITAISISVYCIWIPAKLQISRRFYDINIWWDRVEKCLYLVTDGILNYMFIRAIKTRLLSVGLKKYDKLVKFNEKIIAISLAMDVLIIVMMSYQNDIVYLQFHPPAYLVKLEIEMCMSSLMVKVATGTGVYVCDDESLGPPRSHTKHSFSRAHGSPSRRIQSTSAIDFQVGSQILTHADDVSACGNEFELDDYRFCCQDSTRQWGPKVHVTNGEIQEVPKARGDHAQDTSLGKMYPLWHDSHDVKHVALRVV